MAFHVMLCKPEASKHLFYFPVVIFLSLGQALHALFEHRVLGETEVLGDVADALPRVYLEADPLEEFLVAVALPEVLYTDHAPRLYNRARASRLNLQASHLKAMTLRTAIVSCLVQSGKSPFFFPGKPYNEIHECMG